MKRTRMTIAAFVAAAAALYGPAAARADETVTIGVVGAVSDVTLYLASWANPDGAIDMPSLKIDLANFKAQGTFQGNLEPEQAVDASIAAAALKGLGPYQPQSN